MAPFAGAPALIAGGHAALPPAVPVPARSPALERRSGGSGGSGFPDYFVYIGMAMAIVSSTLNGVSFVLQKKGILDVEVKMLREGREVKHGHVEYLKSWVWWTGTACMVFAEVTNLVAYSFAPSVLVAPMGSMSVFVTAILSTYFLKEQLSFEAKVGVFLTVIGSIVVVLQSPNSENPVYTIGMFWNYMARWWAILWAILCLIALGVISLYLGPRYGKKNVLVYITAAAIGGSWLVQLAGAVGASVIYSFSHWETDNAFRNWSLYVLVLVIAVLAVYQVLTTNRALADHGAGIVMPIFYVMFTTATMITFAFLYAGASTIPGVQVATLIMGFLVISCGVAILYSFNLRALPKKVKELFRPGQAEEGEDDDVLVDGNMLHLDEDGDEDKEMAEMEDKRAMSMKENGTSLLRRQSSAVNPGTAATMVGAVAAAEAAPLSASTLLTDAVVVPPEMLTTEDRVHSGEGSLRRAHTTGVTFRTDTDLDGAYPTTAGDASGLPPPARHARNVSTSSQRAQRALTRKSTVGFALDVLTSHAWELDQDVLKRKYSLGMAQQEYRGSLRRKYPRGGSAEAFPEAIGAVPAEEGAELKRRSTNGSLGESIAGIEMPEVGGSAQESAVPAVAEGVEGAEASAAGAPSSVVRASPSVAPAATSDIPNPQPGLTETAKEDVKKAE